MNPSSRGFTLIETLVALTILVSLLAIGIPVGRSILAKSRQTGCLGQLRGMGLALEAYLQDHRQFLPELAQGRANKSDPAPVLETLLLPYVESPQAFQCPADAQEFAKSGSSYFWNHTQNGLHVTKLRFFGIDERPDKTPLIFDKQSWHPDGVNFLYADRSSSAEIRFATGN